MSFPLGLLRQLIPRGKWCCFPPQLLLRAISRGFSGIFPPEAKRNAPACRQIILPPYHPAAKPSCGQPRLPPRNATASPKERAKKIAASFLKLRYAFVGNIYKIVKDPNLVSALTGHVEGSRAFTRYRTIDIDMKKDLVKILEGGK